MIMGLLVVGIIGFAGYRVMKSQSNKNTKPSTNTVSTTTGVPSKIATKAQAKQAGQALDNESIDKTLDSKQLDTELNNVL